MLITSTVGISWLVVVIDSFLSNNNSWVYFTRLWRTMGGLWSIWLRVPGRSPGDGIVDHLSETSVQTNETVFFSVEVSAQTKDMVFSSAVDKPSNWGPYVLRGCWEHLCLTCRWSLDIRGRNVQSTILTGWPWNSIPWSTDHWGNGVPLCGSPQ
jgi:hypothetical protein